jgi:hypothetical protein
VENKIKKGTTLVLQAPFGCTITIAVGGESGMVRENV